MTGRWNRTKLRLVVGARLLRFLPLSLLLLAPAILAQTNPGAPESSEAALTLMLESGPDSTSVAPDDSLAAPLIFEADTITTFRATLRGVTPSRRAEIALARLEALHRSQMLQPIRIEPLEQGHVVLVGDLFAFLLLNTDVDPQSGQTSAQAAEDAGRKLGHALSERVRVRSAGQRLRGAVQAVIGTIALIFLFRLLRWVSRRSLVWMQSQSEAHRGRLRVGDVDFLAQFSVALTWIARILTQVGYLVLVAVWVVFVLNRFPETQRFGEAARSSVFGVLHTFQMGLLRAIPGIIAIALILLFARFATRIASEVFKGIERGTVRLPGIHPETAGATKRLVNVLIWLLAIVVSYPFIPGSDSAAFQGLSVFVGLIVTLGSSGIVGHMMSGLVVIYSRALQKGDYVRIGEIEGIVIEVGTLSVKIANAKKEEFTIPNSVIVGTIVKNYSRLARETGAPLTTSVTIGYDAPWRVVHEMLLKAAERTPGVRKDPAPFVLQTRLSEFYVEYQLVVRLEQAEQRIATLNALHQNIQDFFNERGVQIMTPAFESQPERPLIIPKSKWSQAPGDQPSIRGSDAAPPENH